MSTFTTFARFIPKRTALFAGLFVATMVPMQLFAWGPNRALFTWNNPANYVTFNSMTDNPKYGDERNFVRVKEAGASNSTYSDSATLQPGKEYEVMIFFHNNANQDLNASGQGIAKGAYMRAELPAVVNGSAVSNGIVGATNANPKEVFDDVTLKSSSAVALRYVPNSAKITSNGAVNGKTLPDTLVTTGAALGYDSLNGELPGCEQYSGYVIYRFKADQPNFNVSKKVRLSGTKEWSESVAAQPGDTVDFNIEYKNIGTTWQENVILKDKLPAGLTYVPGSTMLANANNPKGMKVSDGVTDKGINIGNYNKDSNAFIKFSAKVAENDQLPTCGKNTLTNVARIETDNGNKEDNADVVVDKKCEVKKPAYECTGLTVEKIHKNKFKLTATSKVENAEFVRYTLTVTDKDGKEVARKESNTGNFEFESSTVGNYNAQASVVVKVDGNEKVATSEKCKAVFEVTKEETPAAPAQSKPAELPKTGPVAILSGLFGTSALGLGVHSWINSRRALKNAFKN